MRAYLTTSGTVFGALLLAHLLRVLAEGPRVMRSPMFVVTTIVSAALCVWAFRLLRPSARS